MQEVELRYCRLRLHRVDLLDASLNAVEADNEGYELQVGIDAVCQIISNSLISN
jgi:hypothetical protein